MRRDSHLSDEELLSVIDRELSARRLARAEAHLRQCAACSAHRQRMDAVSALVAEAYTGTEPPLEVAGARRALDVALTHATSHLNRSVRFLFDSVLVMTPTWALLALVTATSLIALELQTRTAPQGIPLVASTEHGVLPIASFTPGATLRIAPADLCVEHREPRQHRLSASVRERVLRGYAMEHVSPADYELDFLITPELGGAAEVANIWPERYDLPTWNALVKDQLEALLPRLVCAGTVSLEAAQRDIAVDWVAAYKRYFRTDVPLKTAVRLPFDKDELVFEDRGSPVLIAVFSPQPLTVSVLRH